MVTPCAAGSRHREACHTGYGRYAKERGIRACALCHFPNGTGKPENAPVTGTSVIYFMNQMADFKNGLRHTADKNKANAWEMPVMAAALTPEETKQAAEYFASIKYYPKNHVVEATEVPKFAPNAKPASTANASAANGAPRLNDSSIGSRSILCRLFRSKCSAF
jgi:cytochrome c553